MGKVVLHIPSSGQSLRPILGFSVWARSNPGAYLSTYPETARKMINSPTVLAIVDDILPRIIFGRSVGEQGYISQSYKDNLGCLGFQEVHLVSELVPLEYTWGYLRYANRFTTAQFQKIIPRSKKQDQEKINLSEVVSFLWHLYVLEVAIEKLQLSGFLAGIRSEFFYLALHQVFPDMDIYLMETV